MRSSLISGLQCCDIKVFLCDLLCIRLHEPFEQLHLPVNIRVDADLTRLASMR